MFFILSYDYVPDVLEKRTPFRPDHLALAREFHAAGKLLLAGAFDPPTDGALSTCSRWTPPRTSRPSSGATRT